MDYYQRNATRLMAEYHAIDPDRLHATWVRYMPAQAGRALDVGAGSGRDAYWLAHRGWEVAAVEPCDNMRQLADRGDSGVTWLSDSLPQLASLPSSTYDLILASAVWMHLSLTEQHLPIAASTIC